LYCISFLPRNLLESGMKYSYGPYYFNLTWLNGFYILLIIYLLILFLYVYYRTYYCLYEEDFEKKKKIFK
jgi:hypothetical protein